MIGAKTRFHNLLEKLVVEEVEKVRDDMSTGLSDFNQYWRCVGIIEGLRGALRLCDDIERDLDQ